MFNESGEFPNNQKRDPNIGPKLQGSCHNDAHKEDLFLTATWAPLLRPELGASTCQPISVMSSLEVCQAHPFSQGSKYQNRF